MTISKKNLVKLINEILTENFNKHWPIRFLGLLLVFAVTGKFSKIIQLSIKYYLVFFGFACVGTGLCYLITQHQPEIKRMLLKTFLAVGFCLLVVGFFLNGIEDIFQKMTEYKSENADGSSESNKQTNEKKNREELIAESVLGGNVERVVSFRNKNSDREYIAAVRSDTGDVINNQVYVIGQIGENYFRIWNSGPIFGYVDFLEASDIDGDGTNEVIFSSSDFGTGAGTRTIYLYSSIRKQLYKIQEDYDWQDTDTPINPEINISPKPDETFMESIESYLSKKNLLESLTIVDYEKPEFAMQKWRKQNGALKNGVIDLSFYKGKPLDGSYEKEDGYGVLDTGEIVYVGCFKGPLYGYIKKENLNFIVYAPAWIYDWPESLTFDGQTLWFTTHRNKYLISFSFGSKELNCYAGWKNHSFPNVDDIDFEKNVLIITTQNGKIEIPKNEYKYLRLTNSDLPWNHPANGGI